MERKRVLQFLVLFLVFGGLLSVVQVWTFGSLTGFIVYEQITEGDFSGGVYLNTEYSNGSLILESESLSGSYTSAVFDAGQESKWNNVSWEGLGDLVFTLRTCDDVNCTSDSWNEIHFTPPSDLVVTDNRYFQYKIDFSRNDSEQTTAIYNFSIDYDLLNVSPVLEIVYPQDGATYGNNETIELNFSVSDTNLDSCWYNLDGSNNLSIPNCQNINFSTTQGTQILNLYANNTFGYISLANTTFSVNNSLPSVVLISPLDSYISGNGTILFSYLPSDEDLESCSLYGDFSGIWNSSQTEFSPINGDLNSFSLDLDEGNYSWNIYCNDTVGNLVSSINSSFKVDFSKPVVELLEPNGTKEDKTNIPLTFSVVDESPVKCEFEVNIVDSGTTFAFSLDECQNVEFNVAIEADYETNLKVEDSAGNVEYRSSNFEVGQETSEAVYEDSLTDEEVPAISGDASLILSDLENIKMKRGESEFLNLEVLNEGEKFLNGCKLFGSGSQGDWISSSQSEDLSSGQKAEYIFNLNVPLDAEPKDYSIDILINCDEASERTVLDVEVEGLEFDVLILSSERIGNKLRVVYLIEDFSNVAQELVVKYSLINSEGVVVYSGEEIVNLNAGSGEEFVLEFDLPKDSIGEFDLIFDVSNGIDSFTEEMDLVLSANGLSGFAISGDNLKTLSWFGGFVFVLLSFYFVFKFLRKHRKKIEEKDGRHFIDVDFNE